MAPGRKG